MPRKKPIDKLTHWWQRNFGYVYASANGKDWYRFRAWFGHIGYFALYWIPSPFIVRLGDDHRLIIANKDLSCCGKPYSGWQWDYEPHGRCVGEGGAW